MQRKDANRVADIWLDTNLKAHDFISGQYWKGNFALVKEMLPLAEVYVYEDGQDVQGFIGLNDEYIEGIFVCAKMQSQGVGKVLLDFVKDRKGNLRLKVYRKNARAIRFYQREEFTVQGEDLDKNTNEKEYVMAWTKEK